MSLDLEIQAAIGHFWRTRDGQAASQSETERAERGQRGAVLGGAQMGGFARIVTKALTNAGVPPEAIFFDRGAVVPGFFRPTKSWDLLVVHEGRLVGLLEFKSQMGPSFGNNYNNRVEEALGSASDVLRAYREGVFAPSPKPWLGYMMLLEEAQGSTRSTRTPSKHFPVLPELNRASYAQRYVELCLRIVRENLYDAACFMQTSRDGNPGFAEPHEELRFSRLVTSFAGHAGAILSE